MHVEMDAPGMMLAFVDTGNGAQNKLTLTLMLSCLIQRQGCGSPLYWQPMQVCSDLNEESGVSDD